MNAFSFSIIFFIITHGLSTVGVRLSKPKTSTLTLSNHKTIKKKNNYNLTVTDYIYINLRHNLSIGLYRKEHIGFLVVG